MKTEKVDHAKIELAKLAELFRSGKAPEILARTVISSKNLPSSKWTILNRVIAYMQTGEPDCRGYRQWQEIGRQVNAGEKAAYILYPRLVKDREAEKEGIEKTICLGFGTCPVFAYSQTAGADIPELAPREPLPLQEVAEDFGLSVKFQFFNGSYYGSYSDKNKAIVLCTHEEQTFFHELAHASHSLISGGLKGGQDAKQEIVAELSSCVLARLYGRQIPNEGKSYEYILEYAQKISKESTKVIIEMMGETEKVINQIIDIKETKLAIAV